MIYAATLLTLPMGFLLGFGFVAYMAHVATTAATKA